MLREGNSGALSAVTATATGPMARAVLAADADLIVIISESQTCILMPLIGASASTALGGGGARRRRSTRRATLGGEGGGRARRRTAATSSAAAAVGAERRRRRQAARRVPLFATTLLIELSSGLPSDAHI